MKKLLTIILLISFLIHLTSCGNKTDLTMDNYEDYLSKMSGNHYVVRREDFNNRDIVFEGKSWKWDLVAEKMSSDTVICTVGTDKTVSLKVRNVLAFIIEKDSAKNKASNLSCFWVLKAPKIGLSVRVR